MEKVLVVGSNTRPVACSLKKLGFTVYAVDYFCTKDLVKCSDHRNCVLSQKPYESCGKLSQECNESVLKDAASDFVDEVDSIICTSGASPRDFPKKKVVGNKDTQDVEDKYKLYKKLESEFKLPETFLVHSLEEAHTRASQYTDKKFLLKPLSGSGGIDIINLEDMNPTIQFHEAILQEVIDGESISASVLSTEHEARTILTSKQIVGDDGLGQMEPYGYCGNITPHPDAEKAGKVAEDLVESLGLIGSNGVDMIQSGEDIYIVEVNPRLQGTFECAEASLNINMVEAHIKACKGELMDISAPENFAVKKIVFAKERSLVEKQLNFSDVYDIPHDKAVIEKGEPVATVVSSNRVLEDAVCLANKSVERVYDSLRHYPESQSRDTN